MTGDVGRAGVTSARNALAMTRRPPCPCCDPERCAWCKSAGTIDPTRGTVMTDPTTQEDDR